MESLLNLVIGNAAAWVMYVYVFPVLFDIALSAKQGVGVVLMFDVLSVTRTYLLRRLFNWEPWKR